MSQAGFFDFEQRLDQLNAHGNPLERLNEAVGFERFRSTLDKVHERHRKSHAGRKPCDVVVMFKMLVLGVLYNLSDAQVEYQVRDRVSFMAFLGLGPGDPVPDEKTLWLFRDRLSRLGLVDELFERFDRTLNERGFRAQKGSLIDANLVEVPRQRNTRDENAQIKRGERPESFDDPQKPARGRQKDTDARWTLKHNKRYFGYKNHVNVDAKHKLIRKHAVTDAAVHDSQVIEDVLDDGNTNKGVYADSAYRSRKISDSLIGRGYRDRIHRKGVRGRPLDDRAKAANRNKSRVRVRVEHVFGRQAQKLGGTLMRCIGITRARTTIGLWNLVYNFDRYRFLTATT